MELVQVSQVLQQLLQVLADLRDLEVAVNDDVEHRKEPQTDVAKVHRDGAAVSATRLLGRKLLGVLPMEGEVLVVPSPGKNIGFALSRYVRGIEGDSSSS